MIVKARIARHGKSGMAAARTHLLYVKRDGVSLEGGAPKLYDRAIDDANGEAFLARSQGERHHFRFIVAPQDGAKLENLKPFIRDLMTAMEADLGTRIDWVAADHHNTGHPHTHILVAGRGEDGRDLVIAKAYIGFGIRARAQALLTLELGPETLLERLTALRRDAGLEGPAAIDRGIAKEAKQNVWSLGETKAHTPEDKAVKIERLKTLERLGLAREKARGVYALDPGWREKIQAIGRRTEAYEAVRRHLQAEGLNPGRAAIRLFGDGDKRVEGRVVGTGLTDRGADRAYAVVETASRTYVYAEFRMGRSPLSRGSEVALSGAGAGLARLTLVRQTGLGRQV